MFNFKGFSDRTLPSLLPTLGLISSLTVLAPVTAQTLTTLQNFNLANGAFPSGALIRDSSGNLYGTTYSGGTNQLGTIFKIDATGKLTTLYNFQGTSDGANPASPLVRGSNGSLYGVLCPGACIGPDYGKIFKLTPQNQFSILYSFQGGTDGYSPAVNLAIDGDNNIYGTTKYGGGSGRAIGSGTVFKVTPAGVKKILYNFNGNDALSPLGGVALDTSGNLYGLTTPLIVPYVVYTSIGSIYKIAPGNIFTTLYNCLSTDCGFAISGLARDSSGNLYGQGNSGLSIFKLSPQNTMTVLHTFSSSGYLGNIPLLSLDSSGNLYGPLLSQGPYQSPIIRGYGSIFKISPTGSYSTLLSFDGTNGINPTGLFVDSTGIYGGTTHGGANSGPYGFGYGTVFKLSF
jgi:uncharacterized repeat protein (TIGR03803 family)